MIIKIALLAFILLSIIVFWCGIRHAVDVDPKEPFLHGDFEGELK